MPNLIEITIRDKIASQTNDTKYICGNSSFVVNFDFDDEWNEFDTKTARFRYNGMHQDVVFKGNQCNVPVIEDTFKIQVGVFAGNLHTTTPAYVSAKKSILCGSGIPAAPSDGVYNQIMELIQGLGDPDPADIAAAVSEYMAQNPFVESDPTVPEWAKAEKKPEYTAEEVGAIPEEDLPIAVDMALKQAKESGEFDGADGQDGKDGQDGVSATHSWNGTVLTVTSASGTSSADLKGDTGAAGKDGATGADGKTPVKGTDYFTNADKQEIAEAAAELVDVPTTLPTPNKLTFTGAVSAEFDGSEAVTVEIPSGGGGGSGGSGVTRTILLDVTTTEEVSSISGGAFGADGLATLLDADEVLFYLLQVPTAAETVTTAGVTRLGIYKPSWFSLGLNLVSTYTIKTPIYGQAYNGQSLRLMTKIVDDLWRHEYMEATSATNASSAAGIFVKAFKDIDKTCYIQATTTTTFGVGTRLYVEAIKYTEG